MLIYKILVPEEWDVFEAAGQFDGSALDRASGFIHLSSRDQLADTARRFFAGTSPLVLVAIEDSAVSETLRWESATEGERFPHVYGTLPRAAVVATFLVDDAADIDTMVPA